MEKSQTIIDLETLKQQIEIDPKTHKLSPRSQLACKMQGILFKEVYLILFSNH